MFLAFKNPDDDIVADQSLQMRVILLTKSSELLLPPSAPKVATQITKSSVERAKTVANARTHVERILGESSTLRILSLIFPVSLLPHANNMLLVSIAIINMHRQKLG